MFEGGWGFLLLSEAERLNKAFRVREKGGGRERIATLRSDASSV